jgi:hypothetical protein
MCLITMIGWNSAVTENISEISLVTDMQTVTAKVQLAWSECILNSIINF